jgi:nitrous-oxide reductase
MKGKAILTLVLGAITIALAFYGCPKKQTASLSLDVAAKKVYVPPGKYDEFYGFLSGGFSENLMVYGIPSGRLFKIIPVFSVYPENGYGFSEETNLIII